MKIKKGDEIKVMRGKDKGKTGKVDKLLVKENKVVVLGINEYKRHVKAKTQNQKSEIVTVTKPMTIAAVMLVCPKCHNPARIGYTYTNGKKVRQCKKCQQQI